MCCLIFISFCLVFCFKFGFSLLSLRLYFLYVFLGSENVEERLAAVRDYYKKLKDLATQRRERLNGGLNYYQVLFLCVYLIIFF